MKTSHHLLVLFLAIVMLKMDLASDVESAFMVTSSSDCNCPGYTLTFECTVMIGMATVWRGSAFNDCTTDNTNEMILFGNRLGESLSTCNNGDIVGQVVEIRNSSYTSQLSVNISSDVIGKSIECASTDATVSLGTFTIPPTPIKAPPDNLHISHIDIGLIQLTFSWSPAAPDCPAIHYNVLASNCGTCPTTTNHTTVICTDVPTKGSICTLAVQTVVCQNLIGNESDSIRIMMLNTKDTETQTALINHNTLRLASIGFLTGALVVSVAVIMLVIIVVSRAVKSNLQQRSQALSMDTQVIEQIYEDVYDMPSFTALSIMYNVAYDQCSLNLAS